MTLINTCSRSRRCHSITPQRCLFTRVEGACIYDDSVALWETVSYCSAKQRALDRAHTYPRYVEIGTVSLSASSSCVRVSEVGKYFIDRYTSTAADVHAVHVLCEAHSPVTVWWHWYTECVPDHFQNLSNFSLVHNLTIPRILWKSSHNV